MGRREGRGACEPAAFRGRQRSAEFISAPGPPRPCARCRQRGRRRDRAHRQAAAPRAPGSPAAYGARRRMRARGGGGAPGSRRTCAGVGLPLVLLSHGCLRGSGRGARGAELSQGRLGAGLQARDGRGCAGGGARGCAGADGAGLGVRDAQRLAVLLEQRARVGSFLVFWRDGPGSLRAFFFQLFLPCRRTQGHHKKLQVNKEREGLGHG